MIRCLQTMGYRGELESTRYGLPIDVLVPEIDVAIEIDGPTHFFRNRPQIPLGPTVFKHNLLKQLGLNIVSVSLEEWNALAQRTDQRAYLQNRFEDGLKGAAGLGL